MDVSVAQSLWAKMDDIDEHVKVVEAKVSDGMYVLCRNTRETLEVAREIEEKMADIWTLADVRFKGLEENRARIYREVTLIRDDLVPIGNDMVSIANMVFDNADEVARVAYMVEQLAKKQEQRQFWWNLVMFMMLCIIIMMLGTIIYVVSLPVTVCPFSFPMGPNHTEPANHTEPVDVCKNATNTIIDGLRCLTDKMLPKPCRAGYACKRETYPDF